MKTLQDILIEANSILDLEAAAPTGTEETARASYANQVIWDAVALGQLSEFKKEYITLTSTLATVSMPTDFRELQQNPRILNSTGGWTEYPAIDIESKYNYSSGDYYCYVLGNPVDGYNLIFNNIITSATLSVIYQRYPSGLLTLADTCELPDPSVVTRGIESYVLFARGDEKFPVAEAKYSRALANMMGREMKSATGLGRDTKMRFKNPLS